MSTFVIVLFFFVCESIEKDGLEDISDKGSFLFFHVSLSLITNEYRRVYACVRARVCRRAVNPDDTNQFNVSMTTHRPNRERR